MKKVLHTLIIYSKKRTTNLTWLKVSSFLLLLIFNTNIHSQEWIQIGNDVNPTGDIYDISINSDGNMKAVAFRSSGNDILSVYKFKDNSWTQIGSEVTFPATVNHLTVSLSGNGNVVAIGRPQAEVNGYDRVGTVDIYNVDSNNLSLISHLDGWYNEVYKNNNGENDTFGNSIELNNIGDKIAIGVGSYKNWHKVDETNSNSVTLGYDGNEVRLYSNTLNNGFQLSHTFGGYFTHDGNNNYTGTGNYGKLVAYSADGLTMATTGYIDDEDDSKNQYMVRVFRYSSGWNAIGDINLPSYQITDLTLNNDGNTLALSNTSIDYSRGETEIYKYNGVDYILEKTIKGFYANDNLGASIALDATGDNIVLGAINDNGYSSGQVKIYEKSGGTWNFIQKLSGYSYSRFGYKVDLSADGTTFIGASGNSKEGLVKLEAFRYLLPQTPSNLSASNITSTTVDLNWDFVIGPSSYILKYRKIGTADWVHLAETENTTISIDHLNYSTNYEAQIQHLYSETNTSSFSSSLLFTTSAPLLSDLTYVPDDNFEQALIDEGLDDVLDDYVLTSNISTIGFLDVSNKNIDDLTGIEDFEELETFVCSDNNLTTIDASSNHFFEFACNNNQLTSLILNAEARVVDCSNNLLTALIIPDYIANIDCSNNNIISLDFSSTKELSRLNVSNNNLGFLDFRNGENAQISSSYDFNTGDDYSFDARNNTNLTCIFVDDADFCTTNWKKVDATTRFVNDQAGCDATATTTTNVPDTNFEHYLETHSSFDGSVVSVGDANSMGNGIDGDHLVTTAKISGLTHLTINNLNIEDLTGIEDFTSLESLKCSYNQLSSLNISSNTALFSLECNNNQLTNLDVTNNVSLTGMRVQNNLLTTLDLSKNINLGFIYCDNNQLTDLNLAQNTSFLNYIKCDKNALTNLDTSKLTALEYLFCDENAITSLDFSQNPLLVEVNASVNQLSSINLSQNIALEKLVCQQNLLESIDLTTNTALKHLEIWLNNISTIDVSKNINLEVFFVSDNPISSLDVANNTVLKEFGFGSPSSFVSTISSIDLSSNTQLTSLHFSFTQITNIDVSHLSDLVVLFVRHNKLKNLDVSQNSNLTDLVCNDNQLETLNVKNGNNINFTRFTAYNNSFLSCIQVDNVAWSTTNWININGAETFSNNCHYFQTHVPDDNFEQALIDLGYDSGSLDDYVLTDNIKTVTTLEISNKNIAALTGLEDFAALTYLDCSYNLLTSLSTFSNGNIQIIRAHHNQISNLDINGNVNLTQLYCGDNNLTSLDYLYNAPYLNFLSIENNQISYLDIGGNSELLNLFVDGNNLDSLNVFYNPKLTVISANNNKLTSLDVSNNPDIFYLYLSNNQLTELDVSNNIDVTRLIVRNNLLTSLDIRNGNNISISNGVFNTINNPNLTCIYVDDVKWSTANWTNIDATSNFVLDEAACTSLAVDDYDFKGFKILSNPVTEYIKLSIEEEANYELIDLNGKMLKKGKLSIGYNSIKVSSMANGLCFLRITNKRNSSVKKIIIK